LIVNKKIVSTPMLFVGNSELKITPITKTIVSNINRSWFNLAIKCKAKLISNQRTTR